MAITILVTIDPFESTKLILKPWPLFERPFAFIFKFDPHQAQENRGWLSFAYASNTTH
jgi:hypothetical protein